MLIHRNVQLSRWENIPVFIPGASSVASGLWCLSIKPKNPYIEKAWFGLSWDFFVRYLCSPSAAAGDAPATSPCCCAMRCFQGSKRRVASKLLFRRHGHGPSMYTYLSFLPYYCKCTTESSFPILVLPAMLSVLHCLYGSIICPTIPVVQYEQFLWVMLSYTCSLTYVHSYIYMAVVLQISFAEARGASKRETDKYISRFFLSFLEQ